MCLDVFGSFMSPNGVFGYTISAVLNLLPVAEL